MKQPCLNLGECNGLGDLISATPTIRKLYNSYGQKVVVLSKFPELFKNLSFVDKSYKISSVDMDFFHDNYIMHNSFYNVGKKNERGIEYKHNVCDIRQYHAIHLGFMLAPDELQCEYLPTEPCRFNLENKDYVVIHPVTTWENRTWSVDNWIELTKRLNDIGIYVIAIGKDSSETGFFNVDKPVFDFNISYGENMVNKTSISDCWHLISGANAFVTMDSGLLHLAGTTDANIVQLGSSINPSFRIPYRYKSENPQEYKYFYVKGKCNSMCCSDMKYGIQEWGNIQGVAPLIKCLENRETYECHPSVDDVFDVLKNLI